MFEKVPQKSIEIAGDANVDVDIDEPSAPVGGKVQFDFAERSAPEITFDDDAKVDVPEVDKSAEVNVDSNLKSQPAYARAGGDLAQSPPPSSALPRYRGRSGRN